MEVLMKLNKTILSLTLVASGLAHSGVKNAANTGYSKTRAAAVNLSNALGQSVENTTDTAVAVLDKQGNLLQVIFTGKKSATLWSAVTEKVSDLHANGVEASAGAGEDVSKLAFDFTEQGVAITGGAAKYAVEMSLGTLQNLGQGSTLGSYTLVPLGDYSARAVNFAIDYVNDDANLVVEISKSLVKESHALIRSVANFSPKGAYKASKGIAKTGINAPIKVVNSVTKLLGFEFKTIK